MSLKNKPSLTTKVVEVQKQNMPRLIFSITILLSTISLTAQDPYFPGTFNDWETVTTQSLDWCDEPLDSLHQYLDDTHAKAFMILKDGRIAVEWYFDEFTEDSLWYWASAGKTVTATLVGIAQEEGLLNIDDLTSAHLGESWTDCLAGEESAITIRHQLTMTTGLKDNLLQWECTEPSCLTCLTAPGERWSYYNAPYTLLGDVLESASGGTLSQFFANRIGNKIGSFGLFLPLGYNRVFFSRARDMARFGLMIQRQGQWADEVVLGDMNYYNEMITPSQSLNPSYGYLWWLNGQGSYMLPASQTVNSGGLIPSAPDDMFSALGKNDQKIYVVPSQNMVVIRMGEKAIEDNLALSSFDDFLWQKINALTCVTTTGDLRDANQFNIFPNPTSGQITIESATAEHFQLYNSTGQLLLNTSSKNIDLETLPAGVYWLKGEFENGDFEWQRVLRM